MRQLHDSVIAQGVLVARGNNIRVAGGVFRHQELPVIGLESDGYAISWDVSHRDGELAEGVRRAILLVRRVRLPFPPGDPRAVLFPLQIKSAVHMTQGDDISVRQLERG